MLTLTCQMHDNMTMTMTMTTIFDPLPQPHKIKS